MAGLLVQKKIGWVDWSRAGWIDIYLAEWINRYQDGWMTERNEWMNQWMAACMI